MADSASITSLAGFFVAEIVDGPPGSAYLPAIQKMLEKEKRNEELLSEVRELRAQVTRLERAVKGQRRAARRNRAR
jgi:hypothetical protein